MGAALKSGNAAAVLRRCLGVKNFRERLGIFTRASQIRRLKCSPGHSDGHRADAATASDNAGECQSHSLMTESSTPGSALGPLGLVTAVIIRCSQAGLREARALLPLGRPPAPVLPACRRLGA